MTGGLCKMCNIELITKQEQIEHEFSLMHHIKLDQLKKKVHRCSLCAIQVCSLKNYVSHLNGSKHKKLLDWQREQWKKRPPRDADVPIDINVEKTGVKKNKNSPNVKEVPKKRIAKIAKPPNSPMKRKELKNVAEKPLSDNPSPNDKTISPDAARNASPVGGQPQSQPAENSDVHPHWQQPNWFPQPHHPFQDFSRFPNHYNFRFRSPQQHWGSNRFSTPYFNNPRFYGMHRPRFDHNANQPIWFENLFNGPGAPELVNHEPRNEHSPAERRISEGSSGGDATHSPRSGASPRSGNKRKDREESANSSSTEKDKRTSSPGYKMKDSSESNRYITNRRAPYDKSENSPLGRTPSCNMNNNQRSERFSKVDSTNNQKTGVENRKQLSKPVANKVNNSGFHLNNLKGTVPSKDAATSDLLSSEREERRDADSTSSKGKKTHTFFVSSDSNDEEEVMSSPPRKRRSATEISPFNKTLIDQLVNFPRTRKQQLQLGKLIQEHTEKKRKLILPRFNLQLVSRVSGAAEKDEDTVVEGMVSEVVEGLPDHVFKELEEVLNRDCGLQSSEDPLMVQEVCGPLPPWLDFLKSLSRPPSPLSSNQIVSAAADFPPVVSVSLEQEQMPTISTLISDIVIKTEPMEVANGAMQVNNEPPTALLQNIEPVPVAPDANPEPLLSHIKAEPMALPPETQESSGNLSNQEITNILSVNAASEVSEQRVSVESLPESRQIPSASPKPPTPALESNTNSIQNSASNFESNVNYVQNSANPAVENKPSASSEGKVSLLQQGIVAQLVEISRREDLLRGELQQVDETISRIQKVLADWTGKKTRMAREEVELRTRRLKLLEVLQGSMTSAASSQSLSSNQEDSGPLGAVLSDNFLYLGTIDGLQQRTSKQPSEDDSGEKESAAPKKATKKVIQKKAKKDVALGKKKKKAAVGARKVSPKKKPATAGKKTKKQKKRSSLESDLEFLNSLPSPNSLGIQTPCTSFSEETHKDGSQKPTQESSSCTEVPVNGSSATACASESHHTVDEEKFSHTMGPIKAHETAIIDLKVCRGYVYTSSADMTAKRSDIKSPTSCIDYEGHRKTVSGVQVTTLEGGKACVFTASHDGFLRCFDAQSGVCLHNFDAGEAIVCMAKNWGKLFLGLNGGSILPFSFTGNRFLEPIHCSFMTISKITTAAEGAQRLLCVVSYDNTVTVRNASTGLLVRCLEGKVKPPSFMQVSGNSIYITTGERKIVIYNLSSGQLERVVNCPGTSTGLCISGDYVFVCFYGGLIRCYRKKDWQVHCMFYGAGKGMTTCMEMSDHWVYTGNRRGLLEGFLFDPHLVVSCKFQNCSLPFGRLSDLHHHIEQDHFETLNKPASCPWRGCDAQLLTFSLEKIKDHILLHNSLST